mmetsp:Transcript_48924/g.36010  ORF Transcript_48924/g.36010 Transcript_48924/m.36010 type:complete len:362 (+) Transcript_48924:484-1569(+)
MQMWAIATLEAFWYTLNDTIIYQILQVIDVGGAISIHEFGAYFGLACSIFYQRKKAVEDQHKQCGGSYYSQYLAVIGTFFLFLYWPSFNGAVASGSPQLRAIINTVLSITSSTLSSLFISVLIYGKLDAEILLNSTLAGGVAVGAGADIIVKPYYAMICGWVTGAVSALGYTHIGKFLTSKFSIHDTCGVHNLHGMPGIIGGVIAAIATNQQAVRTFGDRYDYHYGDVVLDRSPAEQSGMQIAAVGVSLGIALLTGAFTGFVCSLGIFQPPEVLFDDREIFKDVKYPHINGNFGNREDYRNDNDNEEEKARDSFRHSHKDELERKRSKIDQDNHERNGGEGFEEEVDPNKSKKEGPGDVAY